MADKTTRIYNETEDRMVFVKKDKYDATRKTKMIGAGKHIDVSYRDGMISSNPSIGILYEIYPKDKDNGWSLRENVWPVQVFDHSEIKISYNIESGKVTLAYETGGVIQRLRMVRWMKDLFSVRFKASC